MWDLAFLLFLVAVILPARAEYADHFRREDRREISVDVALITASLAFLGYMLLRPMNADAVTSMSTLVFATIAATMFTTYAALALWVPTPAHVLQFIVFGAFSSATANLGCCGCAARTRARSRRSCCRSRSACWRWPRSSPSSRVGSTRGP